MKRKMVAGLLVASFLSMTAPSQSNAFLGGLFGSVVDRAFDKAWKAFMKQNAIAMFAKMTTNVATANAQYQMLKELNSGKGLGANLLSQIQREVGTSLASQKYVFGKTFFDAGNPESLLNKGSKWAERKIEKTTLSILHLQDESEKADKMAKEMKKKSGTMNPKATAEAQLIISSTQLEQTAKTNMMLAQLIEFEKIKFQKEEAIQQERLTTYNTYRASLGKRKK